MNDIFFRQYDMAMAALTIIALSFIGSALAYVVTRKIMEWAATK